MDIDNTDTREGVKLSGEKRVKEKKSIAKVRNRPQNRGCKLVYNLRVVMG